MGTIENQNKITEHPSTSASVNDIILAMRRENIDMVTGMAQAIKEGLSSIGQRRETPIELATKPDVVKLPKLSLPKFSGNILEWRGFWDSFNSAIHHTNIDPITKFNYLKSQLFGEALGTIDGLGVTGDNYAAAIRLLEDRYGDASIIISSHYNTLRELKPVTTISTLSLRRCFDCIERHLRSLEALGEDIKHNNFVSLITSKFPSEILIKIYEIFKGKVIDTESLRSELRGIITAREKAEGSKTTYPEGMVGSDQIYFPDSNSAEMLLARERYTKGKTCIFCKESHWSDECSKYPSIDERKKKLKGLCFICLSNLHSIKFCKVDKPCYYCGQTKSHHRSLCLRKFPETTVQKIESSTHNLITELGESSSNFTTEADMGMVDNIETGLVAVSESVLMQTAEAEVMCGNRSEKIRILFDGGAQRTFISRQLAERLQAPTLQTQRLSLFTFGSEKPLTITSKLVDIDLQLVTGEKVTLKANNIPVLTGPFKTNVINKRDLNVDLSKFFLADKNLSSSDQKIDLIIGNDYYWDLVTGEKVELKPGLYMINSKLGWMLSGRIGYEDSNPKTAAYLTWTAQVDTPVSFDSLYKLENIGIVDSPYREDDDIALSKYYNNITHRDGRYEVKWPWVEYPPNLPSNYHLALGRLRGLFKRFESNKALLQEYGEVMKEQELLGIIEQVDPKDDLVHYIPHHPVFKENKKVRVVYDASARLSREHNSLNDCLYRGPLLLENLTALIIKFRLYEIAMVADIEKAFLQLALEESDRDYTRFLWVCDNNKSPTQDNIKEFRFCRVPFGVVSSPFLLNVTVRTLILRSNNPWKQRLVDSFYVDNMVFGVSNTRESFDFYDHAKATFWDAKMNLREWASNNQQLRAYIPEADRIQGDAVNVLGMIWSTINDSLSLKDNFKANIENEVTKRSILKSIATIYDPLGLFNPALVRARLFLKNTCENVKDWDETVQEIEEWLEIEIDLKSLLQVKIPRLIPVHKAVTIDLHCFCDASEEIFGTCIYLRLIMSNGTIESTLVFSKCRLKPANNKRQITIPRMELLAVTIGIRAIKFVRESVTSVQNSFLWTDSKCVLHWLNAERVLPVFVRNRIRDIKKLSDVQFRFIKGRDNPADLLTKSRLNGAEIKDSCLWWNGPSWLVDSMENWPVGKDIEFINQTYLDLADPESSFSAVGKNSHDEVVFPPFQLDMENFSCLTRLIRVTTYCFKFLKLRTLPHGKSRLNISGEMLDFEEAKRHWERYIQKMYLDVTPHLIQQLDLFKDTEGIFRCQGRFSNADFNNNTLNPKLLPYKGHYTDLVITFYHVKNYHVGVNHTLSALRHEYWVIKGRSAVRRVLDKCVLCKKFLGGPFRLPRMPPYPIQRVREHRPFFCVGLDAFGPLYVNTTSGDVKVHAFIFTCLTTRALHLELVASMTVSELSLVIRRFTARRGTPNIIITDNAPQFKALRAIFQRTCEGITWKLIPELSPWAGGFYERLIGLVKACLKKTTRNLRFSYSELATILLEIENIINTRPLTYISDADPVKPLTPMDLINPTYRRISEIEVDVTLPTSRQAEVRDLNLYISNLLDGFWKMWSGEYLTSLRERYQYQIRQSRVTVKRAPVIGDIVQIWSPLPRCSWKLGIIRNLNHSEDGEIRSVQVSTANQKVYTRSVGHLYPLELKIDMTQPPSIPNDVQQNESRPRSQAAIQADERIRQWALDVPSFTIIDSFALFQFHP